MIIATETKATKFAVVKVHGEIVGIYSQQHQAVSHAREVSKGRRHVVTCQWVPSEAIRTEARAYRATLNDHSTEQKISRDIRHWLLTGEGNYSVLNERRQTVA